MEIRELRETDDRLAVSRICEESWRYAYRGIVPRSYLDGIPAGLWAADLDQGGRRSLVLEEDCRARRSYEKVGSAPTGDLTGHEIGGKPLRGSLYCRRAG
ncbi:hypothetical protein [uncultured Oscillibacter sp.]|uniref:hypothetical protein n=1 Tax=uncultured Oscillibacter sp. TaxID=876091 RepID=UPI0025EFDEB0|nr:hypothetical protein [uncultured Oscillibacter sp.]